MSPFYRLSLALYDVSALLRGVVGTFEAHLAFCRAALEKLMASPTATDYDVAAAFLNIFDALLCSAEVRWGRVVAARVRIFLNGFCFLLLPLSHQSQKDFLTPLIDRVKTIVPGFSWLTLAQVMFLIRVGNSVIINNGAGESLAWY